MQNIHSTFTSLFTTLPELPTTSIPVNYIPTQPILDTSPTEQEILMAVSKLRRHKAPGPSRFTTENLLQWIHNEDKTNWNNCILLIQQIFMSGLVPQRLGFSNSVLLPKPDGGIRGIGHLETLWKVIAIIIKDRILDAVTIEDSLHGFLPTRGTSSAIIEAKLHLDTTIATGSTIYQVFIDLSKAYDSISRPKLLQFLQAYGMDPHLLSLLQNFWDQLWLAPKQGQFFGPKIKSNCGVTQGDPLSPIHFNIVVDVVLWEARRQHPTFLDIHTIFYADDGLISGQHKQRIQTFLNTLVTLFENVGLKTNVGNTKLLVGRSIIPNHRICSPVYYRRYGGDAPSYQEYIKEIIECRICRKTMQRKSIPRHMTQQHDIYERPQRRSVITPMFIQPPQLYTLSIPTDHDPFDCPVPSRPAICKTKYGLRSHFAHRHWMDDLIILEKAPYNDVPTVFCSAQTLAQHNIFNQISAFAVPSDSNIDSNNMLTN
jgi:Reverse transcriptase (RNA-dependent DNA polymerase)